MSALIFYTFFYLLISGCIIYPPTEFVAAGLTVKDIFAYWLGSENEFFIQYHIRRTVITLLVHSMLPFGYIIGLISFGYMDIAKIFTDENSIGLFVIVFIIIGPLYLLHNILEWYIHNWTLHPIAQNLSVYCNNNNASWISVACNINTEYRRVDKIIIITNSVIRVVATDNWIIKITPYNLHIAHQSDTTLIVNKSDTHVMSPSTREEVQYINIQVNPVRAMAQKFDIRLNALTFDDFQDKILQPIIVSENVKFHKTLVDRFIEIFKEEVDKNPCYEVDAKELEQCIGCMQVCSNIKLKKLCSNFMEHTNHDNCTMCYCRPMWCIECMAKWFASKQSDKAPETWLSSKCTCPLCRAKFCILDVCYIKVLND